MSSPVLELTNLSRTVSQDGHDKAIVDNISYKFFPDKIYTVIGPSGAGKSSLLRLLNRLDEPTGGEVLFHGKPHRDYPPCELRTKIGYLFQTPYLFEGTVRDNLLYANGELTDEKIKFLTERAQLKPKQIDSSTANFSVGEKQRVAIARLLATSPEVVLLDEPTSALDPSYTEAIEKLIVEIVANGKLTAIVVTHHPEQALRIGQEGLLMVDGKLIETGDVSQVIGDPHSEQGKLYKQRLLK